MANIVFFLLGWYKIGHNPCMKFLAYLIFLFPLMLTQVSANGKKGPVAAISFHVEGSQSEGPKFVRLVETLAGKRYFRKVPEISTHDIESFAPFPADDNKTYGLLLKLNKRAAQRLYVSTNQNRGKYLLATINGQAVGVVRIDKPVTDGMLVIWRGVKQNEIKLYDQLAPRIGEDRKVWKKRLKYQQKKH